MKKIIDGWHEISGYNVYVEDGCVIRGTKDNGRLPAYPYRSAKEGGWDLDQSMSVETFRRKVKEGSATLR